MKISCKIAEKKYCHRISNWRAHLFSVGGLSSPSHSSIKQSARPPGGARAGFHVPPKQVKKNILFIKIKNILFIRIFLNFF
jgi:hypothetical protein